MTQILTTELLSVARAMRDYIDALPADVVASLPTMPGFDRDWADEVMDGANREAQPVAASVLRDSARYQFLRDKDAWGDDDEPGLVVWDGLIDLEGNEFDAAIDARMAHSDIAYTAPPAPAVPVNKMNPVGYLFVSGKGEIAYSPVNWPMHGFELAGKIYGDIDQCRAAMLEPVSQSYKLVPVEVLATASRMIDLCRTYTILQDTGSYKERTINECENTMDVIDGLLSAAPEGGN